MKNARIQCGRFRLFNHMTGDTGVTNAAHLGLLAFA